MKTHMNNTVAKNLLTDIAAQTLFQKHHSHINSGKIKAQVVTKRKQQIIIQKNNKVQLNTNPNQHVNILFKKLHDQQKNLKQSNITASKPSSNIISTLDNKKPITYDFSKTILKDKIKKNKQEIYKQKQHEREFTNLQNRIQNCKSINQRKKNNWDPIVNPVYLLKNNKQQMEGANIQGYCQKVLAKNRPKSAIQASRVTREKNSYVNTQEYQNQVNGDGQLHYYNSSVPDFSGDVLKKIPSANTSKGNNKSINKRPTTASQQRPMTASYQNNNTKTFNAPSDLPQLSYNGLLKHILTGKIYKDTDLKVLYVRLCYIYSQEQVDQVWQRVMDELER